MESRNSTHSINSALAKHVERFSDKEWNFSPTTVYDGLEKIHGEQTSLKGFAIASFNATHASSNIVCPVTGAKFIPDEKTGFAKNLHLGTTRVWNADGSINEERWKLFVDFVSKDQENCEEITVPFSKLLSYLDHCFKQDPEDKNTGRNACAMFSSRSFQAKAAVAGWTEVYDRLACGYQNNEAYLTLPVIREFFEDSTAAFQKAEDRKLPAPKMK